jgi:hypothetical protein
MVQRIGRQFPKLEVGGSSPPGSARHGSRRSGRQSAKLPLAGSTPARVSSVLTLWTAGDGWQPGESKLAGYPLFNGEVAGSSPARQTTGGSSIGRALVRCAPPTFARFPVVPGRRHRACGAGMGRRPPVTCLENSSLRRSPPHPCRAPEARPGGSKTAGYQELVAQVRVLPPATASARGSSAAARRVGTLRSPIPYPPGPPPPTQPQHPPGDRRTEPEDR